MGHVLRPIVEDVINSRTSKPRERAPDHERIGKSGRKPAPTTFECQGEVAREKTQGGHHSETVNRYGPEMQKNRDHRVHLIAARAVARYRKSNLTLAARRGLPVLNAVRRLTCSLHLRLR